MKFILFISLLTFIHSNECFLFSSLFSCKNYIKEWNDLKVTYTLDPNDPNGFVSLPRSSSEAIKKGWTKEKGCSDGIIGNRYILNNDRAVLIIYDENGVLAGIATSLPKGLPLNFPPPKIQTYFNDEGDSYVISAYFVDPAKVCTRRFFSFYGSSIGDRLVFQSKQQSLSISYDQNNIDTGFWTQGGCLKTQGLHYWADVERRPVNADTQPENFLPLFLLYNRSKLNSFGWLVYFI